MGEDGEVEAGFGKNIEIGGDLSTFSVADLDERVEILKAEIVRLQDERKNKSANRSAAEAFFKKPSD